MLNVKNDKAGPPSTHPSSASPATSFKMATSAATTSTTSATPATAAAAPEAATRVQCVTGWWTATSACQIVIVSIITYPCIVATSNRCCCCCWWWWWWNSTAIGTRGIQATTT